MKKAIGVFATDLHLTKDNGELVKDIIGQLINVCHQYGVKHIFDGGDNFTNRSGQPLSTLTDFQDIIDMVEEDGLTMHIIPGNHDKTDPNSRKSYLDLYRRSGTKVYDRADGILVGGVCVYFVPYFGEEKWLEEFETLNIDVEETNFLITHIGFDGVRNNDGSLVESSIKPSMFKMFDKVLIGHYHDASKLSENVIYTGSAYQNNFGENITDKGFTVLYSDGSIKFVPSKFPKYIKEVIEVKDKESTRNLMEKYDGENYDHVRFLFKGSKVDFANINTSEIHKLGIDIKFESTEETEAIEMSESESVLLYDKQSVMKDFIAFSKQQSISGKQLVYGMKLIKTL